MGSKSTSLVWNYFQKENANLAKCNLCSKKILTKNANTKLGHPIVNIELGKLVNEEKVKKSKDNENMRKTSQFNNK